LKHFIQISHLWGKNSEADHLFENEEESRFNFLQIKGKTPVQTNKTSHQLFWDQGSAGTNLLQPSYLRLCSWKGGLVVDSSDSAVVSLLDDAAAEGTSYFHKSVRYPVSSLIQFCCFPVSK
jgi:hypothetical protein